MEFTYAYQPAHVEVINDVEVMRGPTVYAITHLNGKVIKQAAHCSPKDTYNQEYGEKLARARCEVIVANIKANMALDDSNAARAAYEKAANKMQHLSDVSRRRQQDLINALSVLVDVESQSSVCVE